LHGERDDTSKRKVLRRLGTFLALAVLSLVVFLAGNVASFANVFNFADIIGFKSPLAQSAGEQSLEVSTKQLAARVDEAALYLDAESLYRYTQGDLDAATEASIEALIQQSGDKHAVYYSPEELAEYNRSSEGEYSGIGIVLTTTNGRPTVLQVYEDSPAFNAGVKVGDVVLAIDGTRRDFTVEEVVDSIRGAGENSVTIVWQRGETEIETTLAASTVSVPTVVSHLIEQDGSKVGYVYLRRFNEQSANELKEAIVSLESSGAQSLILDLRGNPGGYLTQAVGITSLFVKEGDVVRIETRSHTRSEKVSGNTCTDKPLVVLIDGSSASASELTAAALKDHKRATIVGEVSYGKGTIQDIQTLSWGGALKFTIAHYMSPLGTPIDERGVTPDVTVAYSHSDTALALTDYPTSQNYVYAQGKDTQLDAALLEARSEQRGDS
jgi:carboxyl-terminal processing protease